MLGKDRLNTIVQLCTAEVRDARAFGMEATLLQDAHRIFSKYVEEMSQFSLATSKGVNEVGLGCIINMVMSYRNHGMGRKIFDFTS